MMAGEFPRVSYDEEGDIIFIEFSEAPVARTREAGSVWVNVDEAEDGAVVSVEFVNAHAGIDLRYVPRRDEIEPLIRRFGGPVVV
jgi:uncharacterized protein YuzE